MFKAGGKVWLVSIIQLAPAGRFSNYTIWLSLLMAVAVNSEGFVFCMHATYCKLQIFHNFIVDVLGPVPGHFFVFLRLLKALNRFIFPSAH